MQVNKFIQELKTINADITAVYNGDMSIQHNDPRIYLIQGLNTRKKFIEKNLKTAVYNEVLPVIVNKAIKPYAGKAIGEKRKKAIQEAAQNLTGFRCLLSMRCDGFDIYFCIEGSRFTFYIPHAFKDGKLADFHLMPSDEEYINDYDKVIMNAENQKAEILSKYKELETLISAFNRTAAGYEHMYITLR